MSRIDEAFRRLRAKKEKGLIAFLTVGFPSVRIFPDLVKALEDSGVDILELGIPFSDPLADGPAIQAASQWALRRGVTPGEVLRLVAKLRREKVTLPIALLTYYNPVYRYGVDRFCRESRASGVDGLIIPDLPPEEGGDLVKAARPLGVNTIFLAAPTSPVSRLKQIAKSSSGFIYYVSLTGVTGARGSLPEEISSHVRRIKRMTSLPVCVGFGISRPEQVRQATRVADGVIIGSALLNVIARARRNPVKEAARFMRQMKKASCN